MSKRLQDKVALVVGAGSAGPGWGNGKAAAVLFARHGAKVLCADVNLEAAQETADIITGEGGEAVAVRADVAQHTEIEAMVQACVDAFGGVDVLDYNVGLAHVGGVVELAEADWVRVPAHDGHDSGPMADTIPAAWRTVFRSDGGHFGGWDGMLSAMISERCSRSPARGR